MCTRKRKGTRPPIPQEARIRAELQKEIGSRCPYCESTEVGHFEIHHIDENPSNHNYENLLLLCKTDHSRFTKKEWLQEKARKTKDELLIKINYRYLESVPRDSFDYECYELVGRDISNTANGSKANVVVLDIFRIKLTIIQIDNRIWSGEIKLTDQFSGKLAFKYENELEVGHKMCYIQSNKDLRFKPETILIKPISDTKDYGTEVLVRTK